MKIAVAATISEPGAQIGTHAENLPFYLHFSESGGFLEAIDNPFVQLPQRGEAESNAQQPFTSWTQREARQGAEDAENTSKYEAFLLSLRTLRLRDLCVFSTAPRGREVF